MGFKSSDIMINIDKKSIHLMPAKKNKKENSDQQTLFDSIIPRVDLSAPVSSDQENLQIEYIDTQNQITFEKYKEKEEELTSYLPHAIVSIQHLESTALASKIMALILISIKEKQSMDSVPGINQAIRFQIHQAYKILGNVNNQRLIEAIHDLKNLSYMSVNFKGSVAETGVIEAAPLFQYLRYENGTISVILNSITNNLWMNLSKGYTPILLKQAMAFSSKYSFVLYSLIAKSRNKYVDISYKELRKLLGLKDDEYKEYKEFNRSVISKAVLEINKKSNRIIGIKVVQGTRSVNTALKIFRIEGTTNWSKSGEYKDHLLKVFDILDIKSHYNWTHIADYAVSNPVEFINSYNNVIVKHNLAKNNTAQGRKRITQKLYKELGIN
jgi:plasmid replication initiation protein